MTRRIDPVAWHDEWRQTFATTERAGVELRDNVEIESAVLEMIHIAADDPYALKSDEAVALYNRICSELAKVCEDEMRECQQICDEESCDE